MTYRILVTGSRDWTDRYTVAGAIRTAVLELAREGDALQDFTVACGDADGADTCAAVSAQRMGLITDVRAADWGRYGRSAGPIRNQALVDLGADVCLAFLMPCSKPNCGGAQPHDSHGATDCAERARKAGIEVREYRPVETGDSDGN